MSPVDPGILALALGDLVFADMRRLRIVLHPRWRISTGLQAETESNQQPC